MRGVSRSLIDMPHVPPTRRLTLDRGPAGQLSFDALGTPLRDVTFVVVDLETTGQAAAAAAITEIGAVKVRGGEILGEFQTLVNPGVPIPPMITVLTGITTAMVLPAPRIGEVFPAFLEFAGFERGAVLVAHNAGFDVSFLRAAAAELGHRWPHPLVVDTLALARRALSRDDVPNFKLGTLAQVFAASTTPDHRALSDARATTDVLHRLLERLAPLGLSHLEDLRTITDPVPAARRRKSTLADDVPHGPGVYQFIGPAGDVLYVGTATDLRSRVRSYFTAAEKRSRIGEMVDLATAVRSIPCANTLEARVREVRLIQSCDPPYNRRSRHPQSRPWIRLTEEPFPRLSVVRSLPLTALGEAWGPFGSHRQAVAALAALNDFLPLRTCTARLPRTPSSTARSCLAAELGSCPAPCVGAADVAEYLESATRARQLLGGSVADLVEHLHCRISTLSSTLRYEDALEVRERLRAALVGAARAERLRAWIQLPEFVAARPTDGGWDLVLGRYGRFAGSVHLRAGHDPAAALAALHASAEHVDPAAIVGGTAPTEETELLIRWCEGPGARLVEMSPAAPPIALPVRGAHRWDLPPTG